MARTTKKTTKKKTAKKATKKKSVKKVVTKKNRATKTVPVDKQFILADGKPLSSLKELALEIDDMADHVFYSHVTHDRNDFSNWIKEVIEEIQLAEELMDTKEKHEFQIKLLKHFVRLV